MGRHPQRSDIVKYVAGRAARSYTRGRNSLLAVKARYDPGFLFWAHAAVGSDVFWKVGENRALYRV
ncbi:hypothetical protein LARI1_G009349 [Lachnellula arida]|uniref:Uncharacterized protein n=1 Tax=Lachnellula arida TaxID=1316785 RepID=A0A8T9B250_9HELO|nr:hypothetical protein LARI1_G009349 [Lachnellula arida]